MTARRLIGFLTMFVMLHLVMVGPGEACAEHAGHVAASTNSTMPAHDPMPDSEPGDHHAPTSCDMPGPAHCCDAVAGCGVVALVDASDAPVAIVDANRASIPSVGEPLISRSLGPEPPPPRVLALT